MQSTDSCKLTECDLPVKRAGLCYGHYMKQWRYGDPRHNAFGPDVDLTGARFGALTVRQYDQRRGEGSVWLCDCDCGRATEVRTGDLNRGSARSCGDVHHQLEDTAGYHSAHQRVSRSRGPASGHVCIDCGGQAAQWSYDHTDPDERISQTVKGNPPYSLKAEHYHPRCVSCHKLFDLGRFNHAA